MHSLRFFTIGLLLWTLVGFIVVGIDRNTGVVALMGGFVPLMTTVCTIAECFRSLNRTTEVLPVETPLMV